MMKKAWMIFVGVLTITNISAQRYPDNGKDAPMLVTFGNMSLDYTEVEHLHQDIYVAVPAGLEQPFYIRLFDPDCGGENDLGIGLWETNTLFELYGGKGTLSIPAESGNSSGNLIHRAIFARESLVDNRWVHIGPVDAAIGEQLAEHPGYSFFRIRVKGRTGNDGNLFALFISQSEDKNIPLNGATVFQYTSTCFENGMLAVKQYESSGQPDNRHPLPVKLAPVAPADDYDISAEPINQ